MKQPEPSMKPTMKPIMNTKDATNHQHVLSQSIKKTTPISPSREPTFLPAFFFVVFSFRGSSAAAWK